MDFDPSQVVLVSGSSHPTLAREIADNLNIPLAKVKLSTFPDGEIEAQVLDSVRGHDVFIVQSVALDPNFHLMELLILMDAMKRASARSIVPIIPYFGYCRQDRKDKPRVPITAKLVANMLETAGATRVVTMDLHAIQVQGFFDVPVDNLHARPVLANAVQQLAYEDFVVVTPDVGSIKLARAFATQLGGDLAIVDKRRVNAEDVDVTTVIGEVAGRHVLLVDDMCSTAGTLVTAAETCRDAGALGICAAVTHPVLVGPAIERLKASPIQLLMLANTIPMEGRVEFDRMQVISVASLFAEAVRCIQTGTSLSTLFEVTSVR